MSFGGTMTPAFLTGEGTRSQSTFRKPTRQPRRTEQQNRITHPEEDATESGTGDMLYDTYTAPLDRESQFPGHSYEICSAPPETRYSRPLLPNSRLSPEASKIFAQIADRRIRLDAAHAKREKWRKDYYQRREKIAQLKAKFDPLGPGRPLHAQIARGYDALDTQTKLMNEWRTCWDRVDGVEKRLEMLDERRMKLWEGIEGWVEEREKMKVGVTGWGPKRVKPRKDEAMEQHDGGFECERIKVGDLESDGNSGSTESGRIESDEGKLPWRAITIAKECARSARHIRNI